MGSFSLVVCRDPSTNKFLLCQEHANEGFWVPGGKVDYGEQLTEAAIRETLEEAGVAVTIQGLLAIEYQPCEGGKYLRMRAIFYAEPTSPGALPKSVPDFE